ncbi:hypothetical protein JZ751_029104, partial [Albula glossodonta]
MAPTLKKAQLGFYSPLSLTLSTGHSPSEACSVSRTAPSSSGLTVPELTKATPICKQGENSCRLSAHKLSNRKQALPLSRPQQLHGNRYPPPIPTTFLLSLARTVYAHSGLSTKHFVVSHHGSSTELQRMNELLRYLQRSIRLHLSAAIRLRRDGINLSQSQHS